MLKTEFEFTLSRPIKFAHKGEVQEGIKLILNEPNNRNPHRVRLQQAFIKAAQSIQAKTSKVASEAVTVSETPDITGNDIYMLLLSSDTDVSIYHNYFRDLIIDSNHGCCMIEGMEKMNATTFDRMSPKDTDRLLGEFMENFIVASAEEPQA
jgi:hypothetical protein